MLSVDELIEIQEIISGDTSKEALDAIRKLFDGHAVFKYVDKEIGCHVSIRPIFFPAWFLRQFGTGTLETNVFIWKIQASYLIINVCKAYSKRR